MNRLSELLPPGAAYAVATAVLQGVRRAYDQAAGRFDPTIGCDGHTFGTDVWRFTWHQIEREAEFIDEADAVRARSSFALRVGRVEIRFYRGGFDDEFNVHTFSFSGSHTKASIPRQNFEQLNLFSTHNGVGGQLSLTVVHTGDPELLCTGVWIGLAVQGPKGPKWEWIERLDDVDFDEDEGDSYVDAPTPEPDVTLIEPDSNKIRLELLLDEEESDEGGKNQG